LTSHDIRRQELWIAVKAKRITALGIAAGFNPKTEIQPQISQISQIDTDFEEVVQPVFCPVW
jgi:hypothetical protein